MWRHLTEERLLDVVEGTATPAEREHAASCGSCRSRVDEAGQGLARAREADMPEPSPLYWEAFRRQVGRRLATERRGSWWWRLGPVLAATAALLAVAPGLRTPGLVDPSALTSPLAPWSALPENDPGLVVLAGVAATGVDLVPDPGTLAEYIAQLSEEDSRALAQVLQRELDEERL